MVNPIVVAGCVAVGLGGLALLVVGGESRAEKRRAAIGRAAPKAMASAQAERASRKKQIADGLRELEKAHRKRITLQTRIEQAGLSISRRQFVVGCILFGLLLGAAAGIEFEKPVVGGDGRRDRRRRACRGFSSIAFENVESTNSSRTFPTRSTSSCAASSRAFRSAIRSASRRTRASIPSSPSSARSWSRCRWD